MKPTILNSVVKSAVKSWKQGVLQVLLITLLASLITGSLLTGYSVKKSLARSMNEKLGNTDIIISSGLRYFDPSLAGRVADATGDKAVAVTESEGFCQNFATSATELNCSISGIDNTFFAFHGVDTFALDEGNAAINVALASKLGIKTGDQIIVHFKESDPVPANAPFSPSSGEPGQRVLTVARIIDGRAGGNFSARVSQATPLNIFINSSEFSKPGQAAGANRVFINNKTSLSIAGITGRLQEILKPGDIGLKMRTAGKSGNTEIISDRIFLDRNTCGTILKKFPGSYPVLTYLANSISLKSKSTPYSFVAALPPEMLKFRNNNSVIINKWLAGDINAQPGDTLTMAWYVQGPDNSLVEKSGSFIVERIIDEDDLLMDPSLMPDFPGITKSVTCSGWDAGIPIIMSRIRQKDEIYWNKYRGTPKAFISYETGSDIWSNAYGSATSIRFNPGISIDSVNSGLSGLLNPGNCGFVITDAKKIADSAAAGGVDFGTLFLGLGLFIIVSCLILLAMAQVSFFETRKKQVRVYYAMGFRNRKITRALLLEAGTFAFAGSLIGMAAGILMNWIFTTALNTVWKGAVGTDTLSITAGLWPLVTGFLSSFAIAVFVSWVQARKFIRKQTETRTGIPKHHSWKISLVSGFILTLISVIAALTAKSTIEESTLLYYSAGILLFAGLIFLIRTWYLRPQSASSKAGTGFSTKRLLVMHPEYATTPVIVIAAGLFAVIITAANYQAISEKDIKRDGGTGGYLLWAESAVPVKADLESDQGKKAFGLDEKGLENIQIKGCAVVKGDDASCLNLNQVSRPSLLAVDPSEFVKKGAFSFAKISPSYVNKNTWSLLDETPGDNIIYGLADQNALEWSLKLRPGDTLAYKAESGEDVKIVICAGLKSSIFQGYILIGRKQLEKYFPSTAGNSIFLVDGDKGETNHYRAAMEQRFSMYGMSVTAAGDKLASFFTVTNTYLEVFTLLGIFGLILGVAGLGLMLITNSLRRKKEFAVMLATGYSEKAIQILLFREYIKILFLGIIVGAFPAIVSTMGSLGHGTQFPFLKMALSVACLFITGAAVLFPTARRIGSVSLSQELRKE